jgi:uncharacterized protein (UPF0332 family)
MSDLQAMAKEAAEEARILFQASRFGGACSRAYYAMFNMARAMLLAKGHTPEDAKTHKTVLRLFSREFVQHGLFDPELARALGKRPMRGTWQTTNAALRAKRRAR